MSYQYVLTYSWNDILQNLDNRSEYDLKYTYMEHPL